MLRVKSDVLAVYSTANELIKLFHAGWVVLVSTCSLILVDSVRLGNNVFNFFRNLLPDDTDL